MHQLGTHLPLSDEASQLGEKVPPRIFICAVLAIERHDIVVGSVHFLKEQLHLLCFSPRILHRPLHHLADAILRVEFLAVAEVARIERHLDIFDIINILFRIHTKLFNVEFLNRDNPANVINKAFPLRILVSHNPLNEIRESGLVLLVFDHTETRKRAELKSGGLLIRVVHVVPNI